MTCHGQRSTQESGTDPGLGRVFADKNERRLDLGLPIEGLAQPAGVDAVARERSVRDGDAAESAGTQEANAHEAIVRLALCDDIRRVLQGLDGMLRSSATGRQRTLSD